MNDVLVDFEILPVFEDKIKISKSVCQLSIVVEMEPLAVKNLKIQYSEAVEFEYVPLIFPTKFAKDPTKGYS